MIAAIRFYRSWISPVLPDSCRFEPTCSVYAQKAIEIHGAWRGGYLTARRLMRCHPFHSGGYDPVPICDQETEKQGMGETETWLPGQLVTGEKDTR